MRLYKIQKKIKILLHIYKNIPVVKHFLIILDSMKILAI